MTLLPWLVALVVLAVAAWRMVGEPIENRCLFAVAMGWKLAAGILVGWVYFSYYHGVGDTVIYWREANLIATRMSSSPEATFDFFWQNIPDPTFLQAEINNVPRSFFFSKICAVLSWFTVGNYWMMAGLLSLVSFFCSWYFFRTILAVYPRTRTAAAIAFLFFPSVVFWSSGLIKESVGLGSVYLLAGTFLKMVHVKNIKWFEWLLVIASLWVGWNLKYYWIGILIPVMISTWAVTWIKRFRPEWTRYESWFGAGILLLLLAVATGSHPNFQLSRILQVITDNNAEFMNLSSPNNTIHYHLLTADVTSMLRNAPAAWVGGFFRPFIWEAHNALSVVAGLENLLVLTLFLSAIGSFRKWVSSADLLLIGAVIIYAVLLAVFLALSTPNLGTLSRYKVGFTPFLLYMLLQGSPILAWWEAKVGRLGR